MKLTVTVAKLQNPNKSEDNYFVKVGTSYGHGQLGKKDVSAKEIGEFIEQIIKEADEKGQITSK